MSPHDRPHYTLAQWLGDTVAAVAIFAALYAALLVL